MSWLLFNPRVPHELFKERFATDAEMRQAFEMEHETLRWVSLVITGDTSKAEKAIVDATGLQKTSGGVFRDWLARWAHSATARVAVVNVRDSIIADASKYFTCSCSHMDHELLSDAQSVALRKLDPQEIVANLDFLARAVLVLRGIQRASISDCSMLLGVPRSSITSAYCHALRWFYKRMQIGEGSRSLGLSEATK